MLDVSISPGVTPPGLAVICGASLVIEGFWLTGGALAVLGLYIYARIHTESPSE